MSDQHFFQEIKKECYRRICNEGVVRIKKCITILSEDQIWHKPNINTNSIGNLIVHLIGNVNQWVLSTLGNKKDDRNRNEEFNPRLRLSKNELVGMLKNLEINLQKTLDALNVDQLLTVYNVQCFKETGISIIIHAIEHFSYHVGQITQQTKLFVDQDLGYYNDQNLTKTN